jgi:hypothetical protein
VAPNKRNYSLRAPEARSFKNPGVKHSEGSQVLDQPRLHSQTLCLLKNKNKGKEGGKIVAYGGSRMQRWCFVKILGIKACL